MADGEPQAFLKQGQSLAAFRLELCIDLAEEVLRSNLESHRGLWYRSPVLRMQVTEAFEFLRNQARSTDSERIGYG